MIGNDCHRHFRTRTRTQHHRYLARKRSCQYHSARSLAQFFTTLSWNFEADDGCHNYYWSLRTSSRRVDALQCFFAKYSRKLAFLMMLVLCSPAAATISSTLDGYCAPRSVYGGHCVLQPFSMSALFSLSACQAAPRYRLLQDISSNSIALWL